MNKHTAQLPNGQIATRNSKTRTYSHVVVALLTAAQQQREAEASIATQEGYIDGYRASAHQAEAEGDRSTQEHYEGYIRRSEKRIAELRREIEAGFQDTYVDLGWCGRADLAQKKVQSEAGLRRWSSVEAIPAEVA